MNDLTTRLARASATRPKRTLALWGLAVAAAIAAIALLLPSALTTEAELTNNPESYRGYDRIAAAFRRARRRRRTRS